MFLSVLEALQHLDHVERMLGIDPLTRRAATAFLLTEKAGGCIASGKLAVSMHIPLAAMTRALDNLGAQRLTTRSRNEDDFRRNFIHLTDKGLNFADKLRGQ